MEDNNEKQGESREKATQPDGRKNSGILGSRPATTAPADSGGTDPSRPIGPGNPPRSGQFQPGKSGNPKGYPKGQRNGKTVIAYWLGQLEEIKNPITGDLEELDQLDIMTLALVAQARKGNVVAYRELMDRIEGKPVQSTKLLGADDQALEIRVGFASPVKKPETKTPKTEETEQ